MTKYNHLLDMAFTVISDVEDVQDIPISTLLDGIQRRLDYLRANPGEVVEVIGHCDTYEED